MSEGIRKHSALVAIGAFVLLFMLMLGVASERSDAASVIACVKKKSGATRIVSSSKSCRRGERRVKWNTRGLRGSRGRTGAGGPAGAPGPVGPPAAVPFGLKSVNRAEVAEDACSTGPAAAMCPLALTAQNSVVLFQNDYVVVKGSCYGPTDRFPELEPDLSRSTAQITVQTVRASQQNLYISYFTPGLDPSFASQLLSAQSIGSSSAPFRVDNRLTTANSTTQKDVWGSFLQLTIIDGQTAGAEKGLTATIIPFANFSSGCRFLGATTNL